jgi:hypothetical protein
MKGYCMKEKKKVEMIKVVSSKTKRGTTMNKGICPNCGTKVCVMSK